MPFKPLVPSSGRAQAPHPFAFLQHEIDRLFNEFGRGLPSASLVDIVPRIDVAETEKAIEVTVELPGLEEKDVQIDFADDILTIKGEKKAVKEDKDENRRISERSYGSFLRAIQLPAGTDPASIEAHFAKGVLTLKAAKPTPRVSKKIEIKKAS